MRGKAKARWVMAAIAHMVHSNRTGRGHPAPARRPCRDRRDRVRSARPSGRDGARLRGRRDARDRPRAAARRRARDRGARHLLLAAAAERAPAPRHPGARRRRARIRSIRCCSIRRRRADCWRRSRSARRSVASPRCAPRAMPMPRSSASCRERSGALEPVTLDLTGERLAEVLAEFRGSRCRGAETPGTMT